MQRTKVWTAQVCVRKESAVWQGVCVWGRRGSVGRKEGKCVGRKEGMPGSVDCMPQGPEGREAACDLVAFVVAALLCL